MQGKQWKSWSICLVTLVAAAFMLGGCSDGKDGHDGINAGAPAPVSAASMTYDQWNEMTPKGEVLGVSISSPPVVTFKLTDGNGNPLKGLAAFTSKPSTALLTSYPNFGFTLAKLVPGSGSTPSKWVSYIVTSTPTVSSPTVTPRVPTTDATGTLEEIADGTYRYTFYRDITLAKSVIDAATYTGNNRKDDLGDLTYDPSKTHRLGIQFSGNARGTGSNTSDGLTLVAAVPMANQLNLVYDFIPATGKAVTSADTNREIITQEACNDCHAGQGLAHGTPGRNTIRYCMTCHTSQLAYGAKQFTSSGNVITHASGEQTNMIDGEVIGDFPTMIHKIHAGSAIAGTSVEKTGYNAWNRPIGQFENLEGFPLSPLNCRKCHKASSSSPQGDNWKSYPTKQGCVACHDSINLTTGAGHSGGTTSWGVACSSCHKVADIETAHLTANATTNNPNVQTGAVNFTYDISSVTVGSGADLNKPVVKFRLLSDGGTGATLAPVVFNTFTAGATTLLNNFSGSPSFLVAYTMTQDGITTPVDYNNLGKSAAQPASVSIQNVWNGTQGTLSGPDSSGYYIATLTGASSAALFPTGSKMRAVALQGYFTQVSPAVARHTVSVVKPVTGDAVRRIVADSAKCAKCHEWFEGHGGNRVYEVQVCVVCHVPNLSTSGRGADPATVLSRMSADDQAAMTAAGYNPADPTTYPEASNNLKDMIHGIHAGEMRSAAGNKYQFVRDRGTSGVFFYDWSNVVFPAKLMDCETCHYPGTYSAVSASALASTNQTKTAAGVFTKTVTNPTDIVTTPFAAACISCHGYGSNTAAAHMTANGAAGANNILRSAVPTADDQCTLCHTSGKIASPETVHK